MPKIAVVQLCSTPEKIHNYARVEHYVAEAAQCGRRVGRAT